MVTRKMPCIFKEDMGVLEYGDKGSTSHFNFQCPIIKMFYFLFLVTREYCLQERWNMTCGDDHVIMISEATYGRMQGGHKSCITTYNTGCSADVTTHLDGMCSGRQTCENDVRWLMDFANPCSRDLTSYLKVTYKCVRGKTNSVI